MGSAHVDSGKPSLSSERQRHRRAVEGGAASTEERQVVEWLERVRGEYLEMPGLSLTEEQAQRLWGFDPTLCRALLDALAQTGFLHRTGSGAYVRGDNA